MKQKFFTDCKLLPILSKEPKTLESDAQRKIARYSVFLLLTIALGGGTCLISPEAAYAKDFWDKVGDALAPAVDITDKRSAVRRVLREADVTSPGSAACRGIKTDGAGKAAEAVSSANGAPGAGTAIVSILQGTCSKPAGSQGSDQEESLAQAVAIEWDARVKIAALEAQNKVEEVRLIQNALVKMEEAREKGATDRTQIYYDALVKMTQAKVDGEVEKARINLQVEIARADAMVKAEELRQSGKIREAEILSDMIKTVNETREKGATERLTIQTEALLQMTRANNEVEMLRIRQATTVRWISLIDSSAGIVLEGVFNLAREKEITKRELARIEADIKIAELRARSASDLTPNPDSSNPIALVKNWGMTVIPCNSATRLAAITINSQSVCTLPTDQLSAGQYVYNPATKRLVRLSPSPRPQRPRL